ncbi:hypothetical protein YC2023_081855 [Brassica napus]
MKASPQEEPMVIFTKKLKSPARLCCTETDTDTDTGTEAGMGNGKTKNLWVRIRHIYINKYIYIYTYIYILKNEKNIIRSLLERRGRPRQSAVMISKNGCLSICEDVFRWLSQ